MPRLLPAHENRTEQVIPIYRSTDIRLLLSSSTRAIVVYPADFPPPNKTTLPPRRTGARLRKGHKRLSRLRVQRLGCVYMHDFEDCVPRATAGVCVWFLAAGGIRDTMGMKGIERGGLED